MVKKPGLDFSFSGLKTAVALEVERRGGPEAMGTSGVADVAASFEVAAVESLVQRSCRALRDHGLGGIAVVGGVAANRRLRAHMREAGATRGFQVVFPPVELCTDNAMMIAAAGARLLEAGERHSLGLSAFSRVPLGDAPWRGALPAAGAHSTLDTPV
jgi:N6-L-threonylcarbamoyladenine synthase